jgi:hypothetical protein
MKRLSSQKKSFQQIINPYYTYLQSLMKGFSCRGVGRMAWSITKSAIRNPQPRIQNPKSKI